MHDTLAASTQQPQTNDKAELAQPSVEGFAETCRSLIEKGQVREGLRMALETVARYPDNSALAMRAAALVGELLSLHDIEVTILRGVTLREPGNISAHVALANALVAAEDIVGGYAVFSDLMAKYPHLRTNLCEHISKAMLDTGYAREAFEILQLWVQQGLPSPALMNNIACALVRLNRADEAVPWYDKCLELMPDSEDVRFSRALAQLKSGMLKEGFTGYASRAPRTADMVWWFMDLPRLRYGDDVAGKKVILYQEQGLGDTIHFIRLVTVLQEQGADVTLVVPRSLTRLLSLSYPNVTVYERDTFPQEDGYSYAAPIPDLPFIAGIATYADIPAPIPYLRADPADVARYAALLPAARPRIGLVWGGDRRVKREDVQADKRRSVTLKEIGEALTPVDATLVNLQLGYPKGELAQWTGQPIFDLMDDVRDMADTAAIMENLDLVISVDTSPLHLAGALGRPVWLANRPDSCWRWGNDGLESPWYPTLRIFRARERSFLPMLRDVGAALQVWRRDWTPEAS